MPITERLALIITANPQDAVRGLQSLERNADKALRGTDQRMDQLGRKFTKVGAVMLTAGGIAAVGLFKAGQAAAELEQAVGGTEAVFGDASGTIDRYASGAARAAGLSEEAFRVATTQIGGNLKRMGFSVDEAAEQSVNLTQTAADLAATYGGTTQEAVLALGAAFRGEADPAERFNLNLKAGAVSAKAVELGLAASTTEVSENARAQALLALITEQSADAQGQFAREAGTASGQMQIARAELENFAAQLGSAVAPVIADVAGFVGGLGRKFTELPAPVQGAISKTAVFGTGLLLVGGAVSTVIGQVIKMRDTFAPVGRAATSLGSKLSSLAGGTSNLAAAAGGAAVAVGLLLVHIREQEANAAEAAASVAGYASAIREAGDAATGVASRIGDLVEENAFLAEAFAEAGVTVSEVGKAFVEGGSAADEMVARLNGAGEAAGFNRGEMLSLAAATNAMALQTQRGVEQAEDLKPVLEETGDAAGDLAGATDDAAAATDGLAGSLEDEERAAQETTDALNDLLDATLAQFDAQLAAEDSTDRLEDTLRTLVDAENAAATSGGDAAAETEALDDAIRQARTDAIGMASRMGELAVQNAGVAGTAQEAGVRNDAMVAALQRVMASLAPGSPLRAYLQGYIDQLNATPRNIITTLQQVFIGAKGGTFKGRAHGGPVTRDTPFIVGEQGPELFVPAAAGNIVPNGRLRSGGGHTGAGSVTEIIRIEVDGRVLAEVVRDRQADLNRRAGRR